MKKNNLFHRFKGKNVTAHNILFGGQGDLQTFQVVVRNESPLEKRRETVGVCAFEMLL